MIDVPKSLRREKHREATGQEGETVATGPVIDVLAKPQHPYTQALLAALPDAAPKGQRLTAIKGQIPPPFEKITGCDFAPRCPKAMAVCQSQSPPHRVIASRSWSCHPDETDV